jgi:hypothetical protein
MTFWEKLKLIASNAFDFILPFLKFLLTESGKILAEVALQAVQDCEDLDLSNDDKRAEAFAKIFESLSLKGISLGKAIINLAIEAAVVKLKDSKK